MIGSPTGVLKKPFSALSGTLVLLKGDRRSTLTQQSQNGMYLANEIYVIVICPKSPVSLVATRIDMFLKYRIGATFTPQ